jgi:hypothetical protein
VKPLAFLVKPSPRSRMKVRVRIYADHAAMRKAAVSAGHERGDFLAAFCGLRRRRAGVVGEIYLYRSGSTCLHALHELTHAACYIVGDRRNRDIVTSGDDVHATEERLCETVEHLFSQYLEHYRQLASWRRLGTIVFHPRRP